MYYGYQIWLEQPLTRAQCIAEVKGHVGVSQGQPEVKLLWNPKWPPNLVTRTPDQGIIHCWGHRSCSSNKGSIVGQLLRNTYGHQMWLMSLCKIYAATGLNAILYIQLLKSCVTESNHPMWTLDNLSMTGQWVNNYGYGWGFVFISLLGQLFFIP